MTRSEVALDWRASGTTTTRELNDDKTTYFLNTKLEPATRMREKQVETNFAPDSVAMLSANPTHERKHDTSEANRAPTTAPETSVTLPTAEDHNPTSDTTKEEQGKATDRNNERKKEPIDLTAKSVYFVAKNTYRNIPNDDDSQEHKDDEEDESQVPMDLETATNPHNERNQDKEGTADDDNDDEDSTYQEEDDEEDEDDEWGGEEDEELELPPVPPTKTKPKITFSVAQVRAEFTSNGAFTPIVQTKNLLSALLKNPLVLGCATKDNNIITTRNFPDDEHKFNAIFPSDFCQLSRTKHRMTIVLELALKESMTIAEIKTKNIIEHLQTNNIFLDAHKFEEIATAEVGFFVGFHDRITNRNHLDEFITTTFEKQTGTNTPMFETYTKNMYCRVAADRAFARVVAIRSGRSEAKDLSDFLCQMGQNKAFAKAEFIPNGITAPLRIKKLKQQNKYISETTAFPIVGLNNNILRTMVSTEGTKLTLREYITRCSRAEKLEPTQIEDRWLLVVPKNEYEHAIHFVDTTLFDLFESHPLPRDTNYDIPHRPGSIRTKSNIFKQYTSELDSNNTTEPRYARPPPRPRQTRLNVSYAATLKAAPKINTKQPTKKKQQQTPGKENQRLQQSVKQQIRNNSVEIKADLEAQVRALQTQIQALQELLTSLQQQVCSIKTTTTKQDKNQTTTSQIQMEVDEPSTSPRTPASKRPRTHQSDASTTENEPNFEDSAEDPTINENLTQPTHPANPIQGLDPGEEDSTLL